MRICSIPDCNKKHEAKGFCKNHYKSYLKYGNPLQIEINKREQALLKTEVNTSRKKIKNLSRKGSCSVEGCNNPIKAKKLCEKHYARLRRTDSLETRNTERGKFNECIAINCNKESKTFGLCSTHYKYFVDLHTPYRPKIIKQCGINGCKNLHQAQGLCQKHYNEWRKIISEHEIEDRFFKQTTKGDSHAEGKFLHS